MNVLRFAPRASRLACAALFGSWLLAAPALRAQPAAPDSPVSPKPSSNSTLPEDLVPVVLAMQQELERSSRQLTLPDRAPPYFLSYTLVEYEFAHAAAQWGALVARHRGRERYLRVELRCGSPELDQSNYFPASGPPLRSLGPTLFPAPLDNDPEAYRRLLWLLTDMAYRDGIELLDQKRTEHDSSVTLASRAPSFAPAPRPALVQSGSLPPPDLAVLETRVTEASREFIPLRAVHNASVVADEWVLRKLLVSTDGPPSYEQSTGQQISVEATTQADDGMPLERNVVVFGGREEASLRSLASRVGDELSQLQQAPLVEDYSGPVLVEGRAAAQIVQELLVVGLSGTPPAGNFEDLWVRKLGKRILPLGVSVVDDPKLTSWRGAPLFGGYLFDDEGVPAERVELVVGGRLQHLLMSRTPNEKLQASNGHARSGLAGWAQAGIGNLLVEAKDGLSPRAMRQRLLKAVRDEGGEYGLVIQEFEPRVFATNGGLPPLPQRIFKLYPDGRTESIRGATLRALSPRDLRDVLAVGATPTVHSYLRQFPGGVPTLASIAAPALLFENMEVTRPTEGHALPPVLSRPRLE